MDSFGAGLLTCCFIGAFVFIGYAVGAGNTQDELYRCEKANISNVSCAKQHAWVFYPITVEK